MRYIHAAPRRGGFTLIEMLVVVTIILALMALSTSAVMKVMQVQANNNTQLTLNKVQSLLNRQWSAAKDQVWKEAIPANVQSFIQSNLAGADANATARMRVIYVKLRMRQIFPMNFNEALNPAPLLPLPAYVTYLNKLGITSSTGANYESSACLLMALQTSQSGGGTDSADIGGGGSTTSFAAPGGSIQALTDAWGQPIYFSRVPAGCALINANPVVPLGGTQGANDPGDPQGYLNALGWGLSPCATMFSALTQQPLALQSCSYRLLPMVASAGPDKQISDPRWFSATQAIDLDNVYSNP